jgi:transcription-repair coupling factor (superfamily II helicase)
VEEIRAELVDRYGEPPDVAALLLDIALLRVQLREAGIRELTSAGSNLRFAGLDLPESAQMRAKRVYNAIYKPATKILLVSHPKTAPLGGKPIAGADLIAWVRGVVDAISFA